jgi:hypothetical protein
MSDVDTNPDYWDCECDAYYIHPKAQTACALCETRADEQPDSLAGEVEWAKHALDVHGETGTTDDERLEQAMRALYAISLREVMPCTLYSAMLKLYHAPIAEFGNYRVYLDPDGPGVTLVIHGRPTRSVPSKWSFTHHDTLLDALGAMFTREWLYKYD